MKEKKEKKGGSVGSSNGIAINASTGPMAHRGGGQGWALGEGELARTDNAGLSCCGADGVVKKKKSKNKTKQ